jgi:CheY-like chemotaxis protein
MPDTPANQRTYPQPRQQKAGFGFPLARVVVSIAPATGCVFDAAIGGGREHLPVIELTTRTRKRDRDHCLAAAMDYHLPKLVRAGELFAAIDR